MKFEIEKLEKSGDYILHTTIGDDNHLTDLAIRLELDIGGFAWVSTKNRYEIAFRIGKCFDKEEVMKKLIEYLTEH